MAEFHQFASPVMCRCAGFHAHQAG
jgi:hypothetical protein